MKLFQATAAAVAGAAMIFGAGQANATALVTVTEAYVYNGAFSPDGQGDYLNFQDISSEPLYNVSITGGLAGSHYSAAGIGPGASISNYFLGNVVGAAPREGTATITFNLGSATGPRETLSFTDILGIAAHPAPLAPVVVPASVPEPTSWLMMLVGFGMLGTALRSKIGSGKPARRVARQQIA